MPGRLFRALLLLLPAEFRVDSGREMEATFRAEAAAEGRTGRMRLWAATIVDIARSAPAEHLDILMRDLRFATRTMLRHPVHTTSALVTLMLGIGAAVAMFAVMNAVLLSPLPYPDAGRLVIIQEQRDSDEPGSPGYLTFADLRERARLSPSGDACCPRGSCGGDSRVRARHRALPDAGRLQLQLESLVRRHEPQGFVETDRAGA